MRSAITARLLIETLRLEPLPDEGGFYRSTWRNDAGSAIYFLLTREAFSALHQLDGDEIWHFYAGHPVEHVQIDPSTGEAHIHRLGANLAADERPQLLVPQGAWQGARLHPTASSADDYALLGCTLSPPWNPQGFSLGRRSELARAFPHHTALIHELTR